MENEMIFLELKMKVLFKNIGSMMLVAMIGFASAQSGKSTGLPNCMYCKR